MLGSKKFDVVNALKRLPTIPRDFFVSTVLARLKPIYPTSMVYSVSWRCNSRCRICGNWRRPHENDLSVEELRGVLSNRLFRKITNIGISGGEPFLRNDLPELVEVCVENMPRLHKLTINTNGFATERIVEMTDRITEYCNAHKVLVGFRVSIDGFADVHDKLRGIPGGFNKAMSTFDRIVELQKKRFFNFGIAYTISRENLEVTDEMYEWCKERYVNVIFNVPRFTGEVLGTDDLYDEVSLDRDGWEWIARFFRKLVREGSIFNGDTFLYHHYVKMIGNGMVRTMPCPMQTQGLFLNPTGDMLYCENSRVIGNVRERRPDEIYFDRENLRHRKALRRNECVQCASPCMASVGAAQQVFPYARYIFSVLFSRIFRRGNGVNLKSK